MIKYQRNNILFRIASADAISNFKRAQSDAFIQLTRKDLHFDEAAREVVLLEFDRLSHWVFRVERICLAGGSANMSDQLKMAISESFIDEMAVIENLIDTHQEVFSKTASSFVKIVHHYATDIVCNSILELKNLRIDSAFVQIVLHISTYLQHILICLHELNCNLASDRGVPFICVDSFCSFMSYESITSRLNFFIERNVGKTFVLKNYSNINILPTYQQHFASLDINIIEEEHSEEHA